MRKWIAIALLLAGVMQLIVRGVRRHDDLPLWDFTPNYLATHQWLHGGSPYDIESIRTSWHTMTGSTADVRAWWSVYPPTTFVLLMPISFLSPDAAMISWATITMLLFAGAIVAIADLAGLSWRRDARAWLLAGGMLASAPAQLGLLSGQPSVVVLSLAFIVMWCIARGRDQTAGVLLALATALKPQVAAPFILYYLVQRQWRVIDVALAAFSVVVGIAVYFMYASGIDLLGGWSQNLRGTVDDGSVNDIDRDNPWRDQLIHLPVILQSIGHDPWLPRVLAMCFTAVLLGIYVRCLPAHARAATSISRDLLPLATLGALSLLPIYHRVYDAMILCPAYAWALAQLDGPRRRFALWSLLPLSVFLVPFNALNAVLHRVPDITLTNQWWWHAFFVPHYAWAALFACAMLLIGMWHRERAAFTG